MGSSRWDVLIAGSGPAGAIAARQTALAGLSVLVVDRPAAGDPNIGETLPGAAIRLLNKIGLGGTAKHALHCHTGGMISAWGAAAPVYMDALADPYGPGIRLDRSVFDNDLRKAAVSSGAILKRAYVKDIVRGSAGWNALLDNEETVTARFVIDATGRRAHLARKIGIYRQRGAPLIALYRTCRTRLDSCLDRSLVEAHADGWFYAGRIGGGRSAVGYHTSPELASRICRDPALWETLLSSTKLLGEHIAYPDPESGLSIRDGRSARLCESAGPDWIACGDAALAFDPLAGQGLFNALRSAIAAASSVTAGDLPQAAGRYNAELTQAAEIYSSRKTILYRSERRWPESTFWQSQQGY